MKFRCLMVELVYVAAIRGRNGKLALRVGCIESANPFTEAARTAPKRNSIDRQVRFKRKSYISAMTLAGQTAH